MLETPPSRIDESVASWELLHSGTAAEFIDALCRDALRHPAVDHPYLQRLAAGDLPDVRAAVRDYCHQYHAYSAEFPSYLEGVIENLESPRHREIVMHNLLEEQGKDPDHAGDVPHTELFRRFRRAAGVTEEYAARTPQCTTALIWRDLFLQKCRSAQPGVGLGAIGIGTELVVSRIYTYLHEAVTKHTDLAPEDYAFLTVHIGCDDEHAEQMKTVSVELAEDVAHREALRFGVVSSLNLRNAFWDAMLARAVSL